MKACRFENYIFFIIYSGIIEETEIQKVADVRFIADDFLK